MLQMKLGNYVIYEGCPKTNENIFSITFGSIKIWSAVMNLSKEELKALIRFASQIAKQILPVFIQKLKSLKIKMLSAGLPLVSIIPLFSGAADWLWMFKGLNWVSE